MADGGPLGETGGAARVKDEEDRLGVEVAGRGSGGRGGRLRLRPARGEGGVQPVARRGAAAPAALHLVEQGGEAVRDQHHLRLDEGDAVPELAGGQPPVLAGEDAAGAGAGQHDGDVGGAVLGEDRDPVPAPDPVGGEPPGDAVHEAVELPVGERPRSFLDRDPPGHVRTVHRNTPSRVARLAGRDARFRGAGIHGRRTFRQGASRARV